MCSIIRPSVKTFQPQGRVEDWALVALNPERLPIDVPTVNRLDLDSYAPWYHGPDCVGKVRTQSDYDEVLRLSGVMTQADISNGPTIVLKNGAASGKCAGYLMPVESMVKASGPSASEIKRPDAQRPYKGDSKQGCGKRESEREGETGWTWSREWAVSSLPGSHCRFCSAGDSGAGIVGTDGRIGGIITCASGIAPAPGNSKSESDWWRVTGCVRMTYVTPMHFLLERFETCGLRHPELLQA
ncbi:hypothetical protein IAT40_007440 [Kwoniella sp. CBS 6097]